MTFVARAREFADTVLFAAADEVDRSGSIPEKLTLMEVLGREALFTLVAASRAEVKAELRDRARRLRVRRPLRRGGSAPGRGS